MGGVDLVGVAVQHLDLCAQNAEDLQAHRHVTDVRQVLDHADIRSQNGGRQNAHRRILCTRDGNFAVQGLAARNNKFLQFYDLLVKGPVAAGLLRFVKAFLRWLPRGHSKQCRAVTAILLYTTFTKKQSPVW